MRFPEKLKSMRKFHLFAVLLLLCFAFCWTGDNNDGVFSSADAVEYPDEYSDVAAIADFTSAQFDCGRLKTGDVIYRDSFDDYDADDRVSDVFNDDFYFYKSSMYAEDTVIVQKNVFFQSAIGYVATKKEELAAFDKMHSVSRCFGYDGDIVSIDDYQGEYNGWHIYSYDAGL